MTIHEAQQNETTKKRKRGFASMTPERIKEVASMGGKAVSNNRDHMANIGQKGGTTVARDRRHMAEIGRRGGLAGSTKRPTNVPDNEGSSPVNNEDEQR